MSMLRSRVAPLYFLRGHRLNYIFTINATHLLRPLPTLCSRQTRWSSSKESFEETLKKVQKSYSNTGNDNATKAESSDTGEKVDGEMKSETAERRSHMNIQDSLKKLMDFSRYSYDFVADNLRQGWAEMTGQSKESVLERKIEQAPTFRRKPDENEEEEQYSGPTAIVVVPQSKSYWEQMAARLDGPFIRNFLKGTKKITQAAAETPVGQQATKIGQNIKDKLDDAREFWETSQNPIVYTLSGVWDNLTGETDEGIAIAEIRKKDPSFVKEEWLQEVKTTLVPTILKGLLDADIKVLKPWLTEGVYNKIAADIRMRKSEGIVIDSNILEMEENSVVMRLMEEGDSVIVVTYMVQQINCIKNRKGEIIEGGETDIRAKFHSFAFRQVFEETEAGDVVMKWKVIDYHLAGEIPYF